MCARTTIHPRFSYRKEEEKPKVLDEAAAKRAQKLAEWKAKMSGEAQQTGGEVPPPEETTEAIAKKAKKLADWKATVLKGTTADPSRAPEASIGGGTSETGDATIVPIVEGSMKEADMGWRMEGKPFGHDTSES